MILTSNILAVDVALVLFGMLLILIAIKLPKNRDEFKLFNKNQGK